MQKKKDHTGETTIANNGMKMTIIAYRKTSDIDIQFEDGTIKKHITYSSFKKGYVRNPNVMKVQNNPFKDARIGETAIAHNGMKMTIIDYRNTMDVDVQFEDGTIKKHKSYSDFKNGRVHNPNMITMRKNPLRDARIGETATAKNGMKMTIIAYRKYKDIDVQFEDGAIRKHVHYKCFQKGAIRHPKEQERIANLNKTRIGETKTKNNGQTMTIVEFINYCHIIVEFNDKQKTRVKTSYREFKNGSVKNPNYIRHMGETAIATNGMKMTIIAYRNYTDMDIQFEDGEIRKNVGYAPFKKGNIQNPHFPIFGKGKYKTFQTQYAYTAPNSDVYFYCTCQKCGFKKNLTARELINLNQKCNIKGKEIKPNA